MSPEVRAIADASAPKGRCNGRLPVVEGVTRYIRAQKTHHQWIDFQSEYLRMLQASSVDYGREFVF